MMQAHVLAAPHSGSGSEARARCHSASGYVQMNLFEGFANKVRESVADATRSATVQHILVKTEKEALDIRQKIANDGLQSFGGYAAKFSLCGSANKKPDAKLAQLVGLPGEMTFRKGQTAKDFEDVCFEAALGQVHGPVLTQFGYHLILVRSRSEGLGGGTGLKGASVSEGGKPDEMGADVRAAKNTAYGAMGLDESKGAAKRKSKAASKALKSKKKKR